MNTRPTEGGQLGREHIHQLHLKWERNVYISRWFGSLCIVAGGFSIIFAFLGEPLVFTLLMGGAVGCMVGVWWFERLAEHISEVKRRIVYGRTWGLRDPDYDLFDPSDPSDPETEIYPVGNGESPSRRKADKVRPGGRPHWHKTTG